MSGQPSIVCLGEPLIEFNERPDALWTKGFGGDACNVAVAAARLGARSALITAVGTDGFGDDVLALLDREGVDASAIARDPTAPTGVYFVRHGPDGHAFDYLRAGSAASRIAATQAQAAALAGADALHLSGITQAISAEARAHADAQMRAAKAGGKTVSYDPNLRLKLWPLERARETIHGAMSLVDVALPGLDDARQLTGLHEPSEIAAAYRAMGPDVCALTMGGDGVLVADAAGEAVIPAPRVDAVDATGAGDCFDAAFLVRWLETRDARAAAAFAVAAASLSVQGYGAIDPLPTRAAVDAAAAAA